MDKWIGIEAPRWMRISLMICKWLMVMIPFVVSSIALIWEPSMSLKDSGIWNCIWMLSIVQIVNMTND